MQPYCYACISILTYYAGMYLSTKSARLIFLRVIGLRSKFKQNASLFQRNSRARNNPRATATATVRVKQTAARDTAAAAQ